MPQNRRCRCSHGFPLCCCHVPGLAGADLLHASRLASSIAGWPSGRLDPDAVREHEERVRAAVAARRAAKPRVPLGVRQRDLPPVPGNDCGCGK